MRLHNAIFALLLGLTPLMALAQRRADHRDHEVSSVTKNKEGTVKGVVLGSDDIPGSWAIIIEGPSFRRIVVANDGHFESSLPAGVYTARVKLDSPEGHDRRIPYPQFLVQPGEVTEVEVDPTYENVFCNSANEKVVPVIASSGEQENLKGLRRPSYEVKLVKRSEKVSIRMVFRYCRKTELGRLSRYQGADIKYDSGSFSATTVLFDPMTYDVSGRNAYVTQHGTGYEVPYATAAFGEGRIFLNLAADQITSIKGSGEINSGAAAFNLKIQKDGDASFMFEDRSTGLRLNTRKHDCMIILTPSDDGIAFYGSARVSDPSDENKISVVHYKVTVWDYGRANKSKDRLTISIPSLMNYTRSGRVTSGDIEVNGSSRNISQRATYPVP